MNFSEAYNRQEFISFLRNSFLPEDFQIQEENVILSTQTGYTRSAVKLGTCASLDLVVYEVRHSSLGDARVGLSKEAFRMLADEYEDRALVAFVPEDNNANYRFSLIEVQLGVQGSTVTRSYSNPRRCSFMLGRGIAAYTPNKYLNEKGRVVSQEDLRDRFSVEVLTKEFYNELSDWYAWAIKIIKFPNNINTIEDTRKYNHEGAIRLITRLIFVWFLKQRGLIPEQFFDEAYLRDNLLVDFNPHLTEGLFNHQVMQTKYYRAILQNLFFAMLNCPITQEGREELTERKFKEGRGGYDDNKLMRYKSLFKNPDLFLQLANKTVPFLNGGLFDCLDDKQNDMYYDGFSERTASMEQLNVPDFLFFGEEAGRNIDLSEWYGDNNKKKVSARGIIDILKRYNFTVEENMPFDKDVSLDPELLGKVFENLLAAYNPETQQTARKQTGSFYTPREIVQYMVDESLVAHLKRTVGDDLEEDYRKLLSYTDDEPRLTPEQKKRIMQTLYNCKILDPACGSGAFPVGILQQMVHILTQIDPDNNLWKEMLLNNAVSETSEAYRNASAEERREMVADIERSFDESVNRPDYARKLYLIENCIFGVDIQPIAIQISKLRFFISLVVDQKINDNPVDNFGIRPLPNLEAKFVAANSLIGLQGDLTLADSAEIVRETKQQLKVARHKIFSARTSRTKKKYKQQVNELRQSLAQAMLDLGFVNESEAQQLATWDMFDQNASSPFFDPDWMFGVKNGFDIVIGNPPYVQVKKGIVNATVYKYSEGMDTGKQNLYKLFIELSYNKLTAKGVGSLIVQSSLMGDVSAAYTRELLLQEAQLHTVVEFPKTIKKEDEDRAFSGVLQGTCIIIFQKNKSAHNTTKISIGNSRQSVSKPVFGEISSADIYDFSPLHEIPLIIDAGLPVYVKVKHVPTVLGDIVLDSAQGNINTIYLDEIRSKTPTDAVIAKGAHIHRYYIDDDLFYCKIMGRTKALFKRNENQNIILTQNITGTTDTHRIHAVPLACEDTKIVFLHSVNISYLPSEDMAKYVSGLLNSTLMDWCFRVTSTNNHVNIYELNNLPIARNAKTEKAVISTVSRILSKKQKDPEADTSTEERQIDLLVYKLYGLTYDEVKVVDPETPITREEYEKA